MNQLQGLGSIVEYLLARHMLNECQTNLSLYNPAHAIQQDLQTVLWCRQIHSDKVALKSLLRTLNLAWTLFWWVKCLKKKVPSLHCLILYMYNSPLAFMAPMVHTPFTVADIVGIWLALPGLGKPHIWILWKEGWSLRKSSWKWCAGMDDLSSLMVYSILRKKALCEEEKETCKLKPICKKKWMMAWSVVWGLYAQGEQWQETMYAQKMRWQITKTRVGK